ncbi:MAG: hypothetical protein ABI601_04585 [bacterium]
MRSAHHSRGRSARRFARAAVARARLIGVALFLLIVVHAPVVLAQPVYGTVRDSASQLPLPGIVVLVLDPSGRSAARGITDQAGRFRLSPYGGKAPARSANKLRLRVLRMGFRPRELPIAEVAGGTKFDISLVSFPVQLEEVQVMSVPTCGKRPDRAAAESLLVQARMALYATVLARSQSSATITRLLYSRTFDGGSGRIQGQGVRTRVTSAPGEPFSATRSALMFDRDGFREGNDGSHGFTGPDAATLLDDAFAESYCFKLVAPDRARPRQVGLGFEPADRVEEEKEGRIDLVGTLWVDTLSRVLRDLTFRYVGLDKATSALAPEGRLSFRELSNGVVIIDRWTLRLGGARDEVTGMTPVASGDVVASASRSQAQEIGGEIAHVTWADGDDWSAPLGTVRLHAVDSQERPAASSVVQLVDTDVQATTDASGSVLVTGLLPGPYVAITRDARLAELGLPATARVRFSAIRDSIVDARIQVESVDDFAAKRCGSDLRSAGKSWLLARVVTADGQPIPDARWTIRDEFGTALVEGGRVDSDGMFHWCRLTPNKPISIDVWRGERRVNASRVVKEQLTTLKFVLVP